MTRLKVRLARSGSGRSTNVEQNLKGLGLRKTGDVRVVENTPAVRGMVRRVLHLVQVDEVE